FITSADTAWGCRWSACGLAVAGWCSLRTPHITTPTWNATWRIRLSITLVKSSKATDAPERWPIRRITSSPATTPRSSSATPQPVQAWKAGSRALTSPKHQPIAATGWRVWTAPVTIMLATLLSYIDRQTLAVLSPMILKDTNLSAAQYSD